MGRKMRWEFGQEIIDIFRNKRKQKCYDKIYAPYYNQYVKMSSDEHDIYNKYGQKMRTFFIRDRHLAHSYDFESKYYIWDSRVGWAFSTTILRISLLG